MATVSSATGTLCLNRMREQTSLEPVHDLGLVDEAFRSGATTSSIDDSYGRMFAFETLARFCPWDAGPVRDGGRPDPGPSRRRPPATAAAARARLSTRRRTPERTALPAPPTRRPA